jgi:hypothetical protein
LSTLAVRAELAFALGWIGPETRKELGLLRKIRNKFAHSHASMRSLLESQAPQAGRDKEITAIHVAPDMSTFGVALS